MGLNTCDEKRGIGEALGLLDYIESCHTPYETVAESARILEDAGFWELSMTDAWDLKAGCGYFVKLYGTSLFAFIMSPSYKAGDAIKIVAAHTDHPCLRIKPKAELHEGPYLKIDTEVYGGAILYSWLDRPLAIGGKVVLKDDTQKAGYRCEFFESEEPVLTIPSLAIHMNRDVNKGVELNKQTDMIPLAGLVGEDENFNTFFLQYIAENLGASVDDILDFDLYVVNSEDGCLLGFSEEILQAPRLDNLTSCYACLNGIMDVKNKTEEYNMSDKDNMPGAFLDVIALFDNEEVGSRTKQGADSEVISMLLQKIYKGNKLDINALTEAIFKGSLLSLDVAHAHHPNQAGKSDPNLHPILGKGAVIKSNFSQKYATDAELTGQMIKVCGEKGIMVQRFVNRSDMAGGSTLGSIVTGHLPMRGIDVGIPILAMHSARETMGMADQKSLNDLTKAFLDITQ